MTPADGDTAAAVDPETLFEQHRLALADGNRADAIALMRQAVAASGRQRYLVALTGLLAADGQAAEAHALLIRALRRRGDMPRLLAALGAVLLARGDEWGALDAYARACAAAADGPRWQLARGRLALKLGALDEAALALASAAEHPETATRAEKPAAQVAALRADPVAHAQHLEPVVTRHPTHVPTALALAKLLRGLGRRADERDVLERLAAVRPGKAQVWRALARAVRATGGVADELAALARAEAHVADARLAARRVQLLLDLGEVAAAEVAIAAALTRHPDSPEVIGLAARFHMRRGDRDAAAATAERLRTLPDTAALPAQLEAEAAEQAGALDEALLALARASEAAPAQWRLHEATARIALRQLDEPALRRAFAAVAACQGDVQPKRQPRHVLRALAGEMQVHAAAVAMGRAAVADGDVAGLSAALLEEPGSTVLACALLDLLARQPARLAGSVDQPIPRKLHHFWDRQPPPDDVAALIAGWRTAHPGWQSTLYDSAGARAYIAACGEPDWLRAWRYARPAAQKADLLRLILLYREGGVYADADDRCLAPVDGLLDGAELVLVREPYGSAGNNFIAVTPGHPVIARALGDAVQASLEGGAESIWLRTGPGTITRALALELAENPAARARFGGAIRLLPAPVLERHVWMHCRLDYKGRGVTWQKQEG